MPRGGHREKSGRKSTWKSGCKFEDTKLIRVPKAIAPKLLEIAHNLDANEALDLATESNDPPRSVIEVIHKWSEKNKSISPKTGKWTAAKKLIKELEDALEADQISLTI
jgi:hypothetical protein